MTSCCLVYFLLIPNFLYTFFNFHQFIILLGNLFLKSSTLSFSVQVAFSASFYWFIRYYVSAVVSFFLFLLSAKYFRYNRVTSLVSTPIYFATTGKEHLAFSFTDFTSVFPYRNRRIWYVTSSFLHFETFYFILLGLCSLFIWIGF